MRKFLIALAAIVVMAVAGFFAAGGRQGLLLLYVEFSAPEIAPNRDIAWARSPDVAPAEGPRRPNVIVILADDLGYNDVSFAGGGVAGGIVKTPNIDALGLEGVAFTRAYAGNATCAPSRAAILTGRYPTRFGFEFTPVPINFARVVGRFDSPWRAPIYHDEREDLVPPVAEMGLPASEITIARLLKDAGYRTIHLGKWHLGEAEKFRPNAHGFDESLGFYAGASLFLPKDDPGVVNSRQEFDPIDLFLWAGAPYGVRYNGSEFFAPRGYMTDYLTEEAIAAIRANRERPFFIYLAYNAPHTPLQAKREDYDALADIPDHAARVYGAMIRNLDWNVGRLMQALKDEGLDEDTLVIFTSDNGGAHYIGVDGLNAPYRGWKATFYEGGVRVPFFLRWPGRVPAGGTFAGAVSHFDIFATAAGAAGAAPPADRVIDGANLLPFLAGEAGGRPHDVLFWRSGPYRVVQAGDWKLQLTERPEQEWLTDLARDPGERHNLALGHPEKVAELKALLAAHDTDQAPPLWPALVEAPIPLDQPLGRPADDTTPYIYWSN